MLRGLIIFALMGLICALCMAFQVHDHDGSKSGMVSQPDVQSVAYGKVNGGPEGVGGGGAPSVDTNLAVWYEFTIAENPTTDSSTNGNDGIVNGSVHSSANGGIQIFDGINDNINSQSPTGVDMGDPRVLMGWFNISDRDAGYALLSTGTNAAGGVFQIFTVSGTDQVRFSWSGGNSAWNVAYTNGWTHFAIVFPDSGVTSDDAIFYVNGQDQGARDALIGIDATISTADSPFWIGSTFSGGAPLDGESGEARMYRVELSASEIQDIFDDTKGTYGL